MVVRFKKWLRDVRQLPTTLDQRFAFATPTWLYYAMLGAVVGAIFIAYQHAEIATAVKVGPYMGLGGALTACIGAFALARPIIRAGGYRAWHQQNRIINGGSLVPSAAELREEEEALRDAWAVNIIAPSFGIVGTIINGASGFFS